MVLNRVWIGILVISIVAGFCKLIFWQDVHILDSMMQGLFEAANKSITFTIEMVGILVFWMGMLRIGENSGAVNLMTRVVKPFFSKLFPEVPDSHPAMGSIMMNFSANMLGLDNAATPSGLKAMQQLQELNPVKEKASNAQIMFLVLNASGLTLIPVSIITARVAEKSQDPTSVFIPILLTTFFATLGGLIFVSIRQKINLLQKGILLPFGGLTALVTISLGYLSYHPDQIGVISKVISSVSIFLFIGFFLFMAIKSKIPTFDTFVDGAKDGLTMAIKIVPILVAMICAMTLFRKSGVLPDIINAIKYLMVQFGVVCTDFIDALPVMLMKPFSGSGARAIMIENMQMFGPDSFVSNLSATFQGSTETTFYVIALYFGYVNIKDTRYAAAAGLFCDLIGAIAAIAIAYIFYQSC